MASPSEYIPEERNSQMKYWRHILTKYCVSERFAQASKSAIPGTPVRWCGRSFFCAMQDQIEQEWACAAAHAASLAGGTAAAVRAPSATALRSCLGALEQVRAHLHAIDTMQRSLQGGGAGGGSEKRGAEEPASAAFNKEIKELEEEIKEYRICSPVA